MKNLLKLVSFSACSIVFTACPYESHVPIDLATLPINAGLLGTWKDQQNEKEEYVVTKQDEFTYRIEKKVKGQDEKEMYVAFTSIVNETTFLNLQKMTNTENAPKFLLYKIELKNEIMLTLSEITENIDESFTSSKELKAFIAAHMQNSYFYSKEELQLIRS